MTVNPPPMKLLHRFRTRRIRAAESNFGTLSATGYHGSLGRFSGAVEDVSFYGLAHGDPRR